MASAGQRTDNQSINASFRPGGYDYAALTMTATDTSTALDNLAVDTIRTLSMDAVQKANSGHPGTPMALAPLAYVLYTRVMRHDPRAPDWPDRDRFVLSAGTRRCCSTRCCYLTGYGAHARRPQALPPARLARRRATPSTATPPGIEITTGPLGQGIAHAVGMALAERMLAARFNRDGHDIVDHHTFVIASDGDLAGGRRLRGVRRSPATSASAA